jgi:hypothetical protein
MDTLLIAVTVVSLVLAAAMSVVAWTLIRAERERSAARIEALEALAFEAGAPDPPLPVKPSTPVAASAPSPGGDRPRPDALDAPPWDLPLSHGASDAATDQEIEHADVVLAAHTAGMFETTRARGSGGRRGLALAAAAALLAAAGYFVVTALRSPEIVAAVAATAAESDAREAPIELLSLRHAIATDGSFVVTGLVHNPRGADDLSNLEAVVYLFDQNDQYFTTGRGPLDATLLRPGGESAFDVRIPNVSVVSRYRVGFRLGNGATVAHVDRRGHDPESTTGDTIADGDVVRPAGGLR